MKTVHLLYHVRKNGENENVKLCGVYSSSLLAEGARQRLLEKPGFSRYPEGFQIVEYEIDRDEWTEGFGFEEDLFDGGSSE